MMKTLNCSKLLLYDNVRNDSIINKAEEIIKTFHTLEGKGDGEMLFYDLERELLARSRQCYTSGTYWKDYVCQLVAESENPFSLDSETTGPSSQIALLTIREAAILKHLYSLDWEKISYKLTGDGFCVCQFEGKPKGNFNRNKLKEALEMESDHDTVAALQAYYKERNCGIFERYKAFIWDGTLTGVEEPDPITFDDLFGYEIQQRQLIHNTELFLGGRKANNVLLYGDKGTGKSSRVKALLNRFGDRGLKLISLPKNKIFDIQSVMNMVSHRGGKYILFIDDLSFEDSESEYKHFKSILEGGVEAQPENVLVYVTSNRRNLVKETWKDRNGEFAEVHVSDGIQERQSLADRFGLTITFLAPDKKLFLEMVKHLAKKENLIIEEGRLLAEANAWDMRQTGRSGRSAKQFITYLSGEL